MRQFRRRSVQNFLLAAACSVAAPSVTWAVFPDLETYSHDTDQFEPSDRDPLNDGNLDGNSPPIRTWDDIREGGVGVLEEVPNGFLGIPSAAGNHFGILQFEGGDGPSGNPAKQQAKLNSPWSYQTDIYIDPALNPTLGTGNGGYGNGSDGTPDFWWTSAVQDNRGGANYGNYLTETGFTGEVLQTTGGQKVWRMTTTAGGQQYFDLTPGNWYTFEVEYAEDPVDHDLNAIHRIWQKATLEETSSGDYTGAQRTSNELLYEYRLNELFTDPLYSNLGGPLYTWFVYNQRNVPVLFLDNTGVAAPIQLAQVLPTSYTWDTNGTAAGSGASGTNLTWDDATPRWNSDLTGGAAGTLVGHITANDSVAFSAGSDAAGSYTVTLTGPRSAAQVSFEEGTATLTGSTLTTGVLSASTGAHGIIESQLLGSAANGSVVKNGAGTITLLGNNSYTGGTTVNNGTLEVKRLHENNLVHITGGTLKVLDSSPTFPNHPSGNDASLSRPSALVIDSDNGPLGLRVYSGTLDLGNNDLILTYTGDSPIAIYEDMVRAGFGPNQDWTGKGITSSAAASEDAAGNFVIAIADNALLPQAFGVSNGGENFDGVDVPLNSILIKFTHRVDLNLDGLVNGDDAQIFSTNYDNGAPAYWSIGDLDYNGVFNSDDVQLFATYYDNTLQHLPEPGLLGAFALAVVPLLRRRPQFGCRS